jgi:oxygen-independent coproporphyrinogen-3 oxidase
MPLGLYISVPFCRTKCTYCNFASDVFSRAVFEKYVTRLCTEIEQSRETSRKMGGSFDPQVDSIYFGGGTPTLLDVAQLNRVFVTVGQNFDVQHEAEITVECAPGTLSEPMLNTLAQCGVNRVSLGVQSFLDQEAASVGRLHKRGTVFGDITRLREAGISNINVDLIAGLPHQTRASWEDSLSELIASGVPHASVYMLEVDEDSRLGRELIAGGQKYHAHFVPSEELTADLYERACERLNAAGIRQYEISNFALAGFESTHNLKYWTRQPYLGFGVDAHSMLGNVETDGAARFANPESLEAYLAMANKERTLVSGEQAMEEIFFLGLRLNRGIDLHAESILGANAPRFLSVIENLLEDRLLEKEDGFVRLTARGRLLSNEVFERFICPPTS